MSNENVSLYACTMSGLPAYREFGQFDRATQRYCYAVVGDYGISATSMFGPACKENRF